MSRQSKPLIFLSALWVIGVAPALLFAVGTTGTIVGTVTAPDGKPVADATVEIRQQETGVTRATKSNELGQYSVPLLPPGTYQVNTEAVSFRKAVAEDVQVRVDETVRLDTSLKLAAADFSVTVMALASRLETETSALGQVVDARRIAELPINERNFLAFTLLVPGAQAPADGSQLSFAGGAGAVSVNGAREQANNYLLDGVDNNNAYYNHFSVLPPLGAVEEFKVQSSNSTAEFGRSGGAQINVVLKSGTNQVHGSVFEFLRNRHLDAKNFFDPPDCRAGLSGQLCGGIPKYNRNQFGGALGGPIQKDRTFVFAAYEGLRLRQAVTRQATVPSQAHRSGILAAIPPPARSAAGMAALALYPAANVGANLALSNTYVAFPVLRDTVDSFTLKLDHNLKGADRISFNYAFYNDDRFDPYSTLLAFTNLPGYGAITDARGQIGGLNWTRQLSALTVNELRVGYNRRRHGFFNESTGRNRAAELGFPTISPRSVDWGPPGITVAGFEGIGETIVLPQDGATNTYHIADNLAWNPAWNAYRHKLRFGADVRQIRLNSYLDVYSRGNWNFTGVTGDSILDLVLGIPTFVLASSGDTVQGLRTTSQNYSIQDDIRVSQSLTLNLGLRYEYNSPPVEPYDRFTVPDYSSASLTCTPKPDCQFIRAGTRGISRATFGPDRNNVAPRFGFAWRPGSSASMVLRGGYGIFYDAGILNRSVFPRLNPPFFNINVFANDNFGSRSIQTIVQQPGLPLPPQVGRIDPNTRDAYMQQWNLSAQHEIMRDTILEVAYVGSKGTHLMRQFNSNQARPGGAPPTPQFGATRYIVSDASSTYQSLQAKAERRSIKGGVVLAAYTWSKAIDNSSALFDTATEPAFPQDSFNQRAERGLSNFHTAHRMVVSYLQDVPWGKWQISATGVVQSGHPFTVNRAVDQSNTGNTVLGFSDRPNVISDPFRAGAVANHPDLACRSTVSQGGRAADVVHDARSWFNPCAFAAPAVAGFGNAGRNILIGPGLVNMDVAVSKRIPVGSEARHLLLRLEVYNLFNHPNFDSPNRVFDSPRFGAVQSANAYSTKPPRQIQLALRYAF